MSQEDVQAVRDAFDAFDSEGIDGLLAHLDPQIEWTTTGEFLESAVYRGARSRAPLPERAAGRV